MCLSSLQHASIFHSLQMKTASAIFFGFSVNIPFFLLQFFNIQCYLHVIVFAGNKHINIIIIINWTSLTLRWKMKIVQFIACSLTKLCVNQTNIFRIMYQPNQTFPLSVGTPKKTEVPNSVSMNPNNFHLDIPPNQTVSNSISTKPNKI